MKTYCRLLMAAMLSLCLAFPALADEIKIGLATAQTGGLAAFDGPVVEGFYLAVEEINAAGGIGGKTKIVLIEKDVRSDAAQTAIAAQELLDEGVAVLVTPCDADPSFAAAGLAGDAKVPAFSTCASSPTLPLMGGDYMFSNFPGDNIQATVSAQYARDKGYKVAYILYSPDSQYTMMPLYFSSVFTKLGGTLAGEGTYSMGQQDFSAEVTKIKSLSPKPDVIMTSAYEPDFPAFIRQLRAAGVDTPVIGSDGIDSPTTFSLGKPAEGVVFTTAGFPTPGSELEKFDAKYKAKYGKDSETVFNGIGYDLGKVIEAAVIKAGSTDPQAIRDAVAELVDVQGATSKITYKGTMGMPVRQVSLIRVTDGQRELLGQPSPDPALVPAPRMN